MRVCFNRRRDVMTFCNLCERCFFFNEPLVDKLSGNAKNLRGMYCDGDFSRCMIYRLAQSCGIHEVPGYVCPDDKDGTLNYDLRKACELRGETIKLSKVIYPNGAIGEVKYSIVDRLMKAGEIVAFQNSKGWVEVRRTSKNTYKGVDRRRTKPERFFAGCQL